jgi:hypothetical protein
MNACGIDLQLENYNSFYDQTRILCTNRSYDLMLFFVSLIPYMPAFIARQQGGGMTEWWQEVIKPVTDLAEMHNIVNINARSFLNVYNESMLSNMTSDDVCPEKLFFRLVTALNRRQLARMKEITARQVQPNASKFPRQMSPLSPPQREVAEDTDDDKSSADDRDKSPSNDHASPHSKKLSPVWDWKVYE